MMLDTVIRPAARLPRAIAGLALAVAVFVTGSASAQFGEAAGFGEIMMPYYLRRDLQLFVEGLDLDEGQSVIVESLYWDYEEAQDKSRQDMLDQFSNMRDEVKDLPKDEVLEFIFRPFQDKAADWERLNDEFLVSVQAVLNGQQFEQWAEFMRKLRREKELPKGKYSGESVNLFHVVNRMDLEKSVRAVLDPALNDYSILLDQALEARARVLRESRLPMMKSIQEDNSSVSLSLYRKQIDARLKVRDVNDEFVEIIAASLIGDDSDQFRADAMIEAYPRVYRKTSGQRIIESAKELEDLSTEQLDAILALERSYLLEIGMINDELVRLIRGFEMEDDMHRATLATLRGSNDRPKRPLDPTREQFQKRSDVDTRYVQMLQDILTQEQFDSIRGAARFMNRRSPTDAGPRVEQQREKRQREVDLDLSRPGRPQAPGRNGGRKGGR